MTENEKHELIHGIIDELISRADKISVATHYGEPSILLCDVINVINNKAETDYKRYWAYRSQLGYEECHPNEENAYCSMCTEHWTRSTDKQGCLGIKKSENNTAKPCEKFKSFLDI